jgi:hypothetical protein
LPDHQRFKSGERGYACRAPRLSISMMRQGGIRTNLLFTMSDITRATAVQPARIFVFYADASLVAWLPTEVLVEPDGIEPTTSCLQSTRSPN